MGSVYQTVAESSGLAVDPCREFRTADPVRKAGVVLDPRRRCGLATRHVYLGDHRPKSLGGGVQRCGKTC
jgi:hypothetical protein